MSAPLKPHALQPDPDGIPQALKDLVQWVVWRYAPNDNRDAWTKVPLNARFAVREQVRNASSTRPQTWADFATAWKAYAVSPPSAGDISIPENPKDDPGHNGLDGIGIVLTPDNGIVGIDLDHCLDPDGKPLAWAVPILERFSDTYTEISPSGTGLRIFCYGVKPSPELSKVGNVELYDGRAKNGAQGGRYLTLTGHRYSDAATLTDKQDAVSWLYQTYLIEPKEKVKAERQQSKAAPKGETATPSLDDVALLERMFASKNGAAIRALYDGDISEHPSESEADLALASHLLWWCNYDAARADGLFRQSQLMRPKWNELRGSETYGHLTLTRAGEGKGPGDGYSSQGGRVTVGDDSTPSDEIIVNRQIKEVVRDVSAKLRALELGGHPVIYSRGDGLLVEMHSGFELREVTKSESCKALLHDHLEPVAEKEDKNGPYTVPAVFSNNHTALLTRKTAEFPPIKAVSDIPLMLKDGTILLEPGYHREHGYYLNTAQIDVQLMPWHEARALYLETFNEMSYQAPKAGFTATMAFILQPFLMPMIDDLTPLYVVLGSRRAGSGTGKGFLLDLVYRIHRGKPYTHDGSMPASDEEMGKVLFSALSEGVSHIIFDDIDHLKHRQLMAAITSRTYKGRILGVSQRHEVSTGVTWAVSGNAPEIHRDFYRRIIPIYMGIGKARAWEREYERPDLNRYVLENRNLFVSAALSILEHWRASGMPLSTQTIRGFDRWSAVMGGVLEAIGLPHLLEARDGLDELIEVDNSDLDLLIDAWQACSLADKKLKGKDILNLARDRELFTELHEGRTDAAGAGELGKYLKPFVNDVFKGHYLRRKFDSDAKTWSYYLEPVPDEPKQLLEAFDFSPEKIMLLHPRSTPVKQPETTKDTAAGVIRGSTDEVLRDDKENETPPKWRMRL